MERPCSRNHLHVVGGYGRECGKLREWDCSTKGIAVLEGQLCECGGGGEWGGNHVREGMNPGKTK